MNLELAGKLIQVQKLLLLDPCPVVKLTIYIRLINRSFGLACMVPARLRGIDRVEQALVPVTF